MGLLVDGKWYDKWYDTESTGGHFVRKDSQFRNWITKDGSPGPTGEGALRQKQAATTSMSPMPAHGPAVPSLCGHSRD